MPLAVSKPSQCESHLVYISNQTSDDTIYFYDFDSNCYRKCHQTNIMPYDLIELTFDDGSTTITCSDSYRIAFNKHEFLTKEELEAEDVWRMSIVENGKEVDFYHRDTDEWIKAEVVGTKCDITPGVVNLNQRKRVNWIGYFYYESKRLAESSVHTHRFTVEELDEENRKEIEAHERYLKTERIKEEMIKKIPIYNFSEQSLAELYIGKDNVLYDMQTFLRNLDICPQDKMENFYQNRIRPEVKDETDIGPLQKCLFFLIYEENEKYNGAETDFVLMENYFYKDYDLFKNIRITGITPDDGYRIELTIGDSLIEKAKWNVDEQYYYFPLLQNNYLFRLLCSKYFIRFKKNGREVSKPDGTKITIRGIFLQMVINRIFITLPVHNCYTIKSSRKREFVFIYDMGSSAITKSYEEMTFDPEDPHK